MHRPEDQVGAYDGNPEVDIGHGVVEVAAEHLREPVVYTGEHTEERRNAHYNMEVGHYKIGIVQVNVERRVTQEDAGKTAADEQAHKTDGEEHTRCKADASFPERGKPVEYLDP